MIREGRESRRRERGGGKHGEVRGGERNSDARETETDDKRSSERKRAKTFTKSPTLNRHEQGLTAALCGDAKLLSFNHHSLNFSLAPSPPHPKFLIVLFKINLSFLELFLYSASQITFAS